MAERTYDVVVFGATGFTGKLVARYLAENHGQTDLRWAIAGRSPTKLAEVAKWIGRPDVPQIVADSHDHESLATMVASTSAVATTVGPYARYGADLVAACVGAGTHYADLTGEPTFIRAMIDRHHEAARKAGVRIVHCCGFDSIPSDLGVFNLQAHAMATFGAPFERIEALVLGARGGTSGGTVASAMQMMQDAKDREIRRILGDPYSLTPGERGADQSTQSVARYSEAAGTWTAPFVMAQVNEKVVRRSNAMLGYAYGKGFRYGESIRMGPGLRGRVAANAFATAYAGAVLGLVTPIGRRVAQQFVPQPGEGPDEDTIRNGYFKFRIFGSAAGGDPSQRASLTVSGTGDPGYGATSCMLAESAITLARRPDLEVAGVVTPASAMGVPLTERLQATQVQFTVDEA